MFDDRSLKYPELNAKLSRNPYKGLENTALHGVRKTTQSTFITIQNNDIDSVFCNTHQYNVMARA